MDWSRGGRPLSLVDVGPTHLVFAIDGDGPGTGIRRAVGSNFESTDPLPFLRNMPAAAATMPAVTNAVSAVDGANVAWRRIKRVLKGIIGTVPIWLCSRVAVNYRIELTTVYAAI